MINNSYVLGLFGGSFDNSSSAGSAALTQLARKQPTPPWSPTAQTPKPDALVRAALGGRRFINEDAAQLDLKSASDDYRKLFALYQGLDTLSALTNRAATKGVSALEVAQLNKRFAAGLDEVGAWLSAADLSGVRLAQGTAASISKTGAAVAKDSAVSVTAPVHEGSPDALSAAFAGAVAFDISVRTMTGTTTVAIDLAEMGATPRTLNAVLSHVNGKLETAGVATRIGREQVKADPKTITVNGKPVTLPAGADKWALAVRGDSAETIGFAASARADAVYVVQGAGTTGGHQLLKFQTDTGGAPPDALARPGETHWVAGRAGQTALPPGVETVRASAAGPDGSLWLVADVDAGPANQPIKGQRDVALIKLDSAGRVVSTRALGAASTASGYAIAVDAGGRVAVAGSVTGALEPGKSGEVATVADSFVTVFDAEGAEVWTQRRGAREADEATSVSFGSNGTVYVGGRSQGAIPGAAGQGGWDGYVQAFSESQAHIYAPVVATSVGVSQFGTTAEDGVGAVVVDGANLYSAGVEDGRFIVRRFTLDGAGKPTLAATRDLGLARGEVAGISVSGGRVILSGTTRTDNLNIGTVNTAHHGGTDAFIAVLEGDLTASANDRLTYVGAAGDDTAADVKVAGGKVWISGVANRALGAKETDPSQAFLARLNADTGAVEWRRDWQGESEKAVPLTLAVASNGASVLDRLGLPQGEIDQSQSKLLTIATSVRVGDRFYVSPADGGRPVAVTIEARDTLQMLARKIEQASNRKLKVTIASDTGVAGKQGETPQSVLAGFQKLSITARDGKTGAVLTAGEPGRDALAGLGLSQGYVGPTTGDGGVRTFGLDLPRTLTLNDAAAVKASGERLQAAMKAVRDAYRALAPASTTGAATGPAPAYLRTQLANYQAALARLGG
ncbi:MAG: transcriptional regulator [Pseudomonadota bacterium]|nr:transcriptional regulator [Pseudomonadota bacterium]